MNPHPQFWSRIDRFLTTLRPQREPMSLLIDAFVIAAAWNVTYLFRLGFERWWTARPGYDLYVMGGVVAAYLVTFVVAGVPRGMWRFSGFGELKRLAIACLVAGLASGIVVLMAQLTQVPRAVLALHPVVSLMGLCLVRMGYRMLYEHARVQITRGEGDARRVLVMGAGEAARRLLATIHDEGWICVGLLDDDPAKLGARVSNVPVRGTLDDAKRVAKKEGATHVVVVMPGAKTAQRRRAVDLGGATGLPVLTVPSASELQDGRAVADKVRAIEPEDLLGREPVVLDEPGIASLISGKTVLVTGGGGSIGSELCRQIARYGPARLVVFELSEFALYQIEQQLAELHPQLPVVCLIGDVKRFGQIRHVCETHRPHLVFHAAAYKHVPMLEDENAWMALQNNTLGTFNAATAAALGGAERFVFVSTDKAVNPTNVMGASKRAAEMVLSHLSTQSGKTRFVAVRFGNVLGSSGSVIPKFKEQIAKGGPVTVTHPDITRYFMTIPEASRLVLQAAALAESGQVYVLDMGEPVRIVDLARDLIRLSGHRRNEIAITFTGLRPGEKLYEELLADADDTLASAHPRLRIARLHEPAGEPWMQETLRWLHSLDESTPRADWRAGLRKLVPEYRTLD